MTAETPNAKNHAGLATLDSRYVNVAALPWETTRFPGIEMKTLLRDTDSGLQTLLMRMAPGAELPDHEHVRMEQTYVLEGSLADAQGTVTAGNYVWRPAGSRHSACAPDGALLLGFFLEPNRFADEGASERE